MLSVASWPSCKLFGSAGKCSSVEQSAGVTTACRLEQSCAALAARWQMRNGLQEWAMAARESAGQKRRTALQ